MFPSRMSESRKGANPFSCCRWSFWFLLALLSSCTLSTDWVNNAYTEPDAQMTHSERVAFWQDQLLKKPKDTHLLVRMYEARQAAIIHYLRQGHRYLGESDYEQAMDSYHQGLLLDPDAQVLKDAISSLTARRQTVAWLAEAKALEKERVNLRRVESLLYKARAADPLNADVAHMLSRIQARIRYYNKKEQPTVDLNFKQIDFKQAMYFVCRSVGVNVIFDQSVKDSQVTMSVDDVAFNDAVNLLVSTTKHSYKVLNESALLIFADTKDRHKHFDDLNVRTFYLKTVAAKDMASLIKGVLGLSKITVNEANNSLVVYDTPQTIASIERIITEHDLLPGEVVLEVEILEVNLSNADRFGLDYGAYQVSANTASIPLSGSLSTAIENNTTLNIPSVNFNFFKQKVGAKLLANPSIRVLDGKAAKIHIGDRVPLRKSTIQDATGQTRTTFEYQEIGIRFNVEAFLNASEYVTVSVALEVSALGENLGTATEQAFRIGTRNADSTMLVRDGETAIMGGLIREEGRTTRSNIRGLGFLDGLTSNKDESSGRTDLLLTITPRVIRPSSARDQAGINQLALGADVGADSLDTLKLRPKINNDDLLAGEAIKKEPRLVVDQSHKAVPASSKPLLLSETSIDNLSEEGASSSLDANQDLLVFKTQLTAYKATEGQLFTVSIDAAIWRQLGFIRFSLVFNDSVIRYESARWRNDEAVLMDTIFEQGNNQAQFSVDLSNDALKDPEGTLDITFKARLTGSSFLVLRIDEARGHDNQILHLEAVNSRVIVE